MREYIMVHGNQLVRRVSLAGPDVADACRAVLGEEFQLLCREDAVWSQDQATLALIAEHLPEPTAEEVAARRSQQWLSQPLLLLSHREDYDVNLQTFVGYAAASEYLGKQLAKKPHENWVNLLVRNFHELCERAESALPDAHGEDSITLPGLYEESDEETADREYFQGRLREEVARVLGSDSQEHLREVKRKQQEAYRKQQEERNRLDREKYIAETPARRLREEREAAVRRAQELAELDRLCRKYPDAVAERLTTGEGS